MIRADEHRFDAGGAQFNAKAGLSPLDGLLNIHVTNPPLLICLFSQYIKKGGPGNHRGPSLEMQLILLRARQRTLERQ